jgi:PAS domain S-box-containing protein
MNGQRFGVRKDWPQLARILDQALVAMPAQRKNEIIQAWMPGRVGDIHRLSQPTLIARLFPWLAGGLGLAVLGYLVILLWNRQLRLELARRKAELERAQHIAHLGDWSMDPAGEQIQWSDELFHMVGRSPCELDWRTLRSWIHPEERDANEHYLSQLAALTEGESLPPLVSHLLRPDGGSCWLEITGTTEFDRMGKPCRYVGTALDVTERKKQETELKRLHSILNALVEGSTDTIFVKDCEGRYLVVNQAMSALVGRPLDAILGADDHALFAAELAERFRADDQRIMKADAAHSYEEVVVTHDATYHYLTTKGPLIIDGEVRGVFGIARDITGRKRIEAALQESESRLRLFIEHAPAALAMFDREMRYLAFSTRWLSDYELESDVLGQSHYTVFPDIPESWKTVHRRGLAGEVVKASEDRFVRKDGTVQWLRWEVRPWIGADGGVGGICIFSEDITANKIAETELRRQKDLLARTGRLAKVGGWEIDVATMQYTMADEVLHIFDLEPDPQVTEAPLIACLLESDRRRLDQVQRDAIESRQPYELELELDTAKGVHKWIHVVGLPVLEGGRVVRLEGAVQDITERKQVEERAQRSWMILDSVFQALPDLFFLMEANGTIRDYRAQKGKLYVSPEVFLGKRMQDVLPPELGARFGNKVAEIGKRGGLITFEYDMPMPDGPRHFEARLTQLPGSTQLIAVVRDITRQHMDHQALGDSESRYRHLFERNPAPMLVYELSSLRLLAVNEAFMRHYGYTHDEALALKLTDLYPDEEKQPIVDLTTHLSGLAYVGEWHHLKKDGSQITIEARSHDLQYQDRAARVAVITDVTERKRAEQVLRDSEARYRSLLELAPFPAVLTRVRDGILLYGNRRAEIQYGISREQGIGQPAERFYEDRSQRERFLEPLQKTGKVEDLEVRMRTADGHPFWALVSASVVEFENEPAIFTAINDITVRKQVEAALQEQEAFFRLIAENMGDMVAVLDLDGRRLYNSPSYQTLFGDPDVLKGTDSFAEIHPDDRDRVREVFMETVRTGHGHRADFRFVLPDEQVRYMESQGGVIRGADGQVERVVVVSRDVTERRQMEDEIRQLKTELEERVRQRTAELANANKELETFTYSVSHDLKAPLRGIDGYSRLLLEDYQDRLDQAGRQLVNNVRSGVVQMSQLIEDLLAYSRMERRSLLGQTLDLSQVVAKVLGEMQAGIQQHGMVVDMSLQGLTARADPEGLSIVLRNLIDNAIKFSRDSHPPTLSITGVAGEKSTTLIVRDNGIGFDMQFHNRIFEIFQRLQRAEEYPGTGVGLAIVYKAMQRMGGDVRAESEPGKGTTFYLELPR